MPISTEDRSRLLELARAAVEAEIRGEPRPAPDSGGICSEKRGCFVTLTNGGRLRGCIGTFSPTAPLGETLVEIGAAAARDPRFVGDPVTPSELPELRVEVSVLSPLEETDDPLGQIRIGEHGIYIVGRSAGCFLPEVATELGWSAEEFLDNCCTSKALMPPGAWREPGTKVYLFTSEKFSD
jgi:AmmeMemoRadiSam system protein A